MVIAREADNVIQLNITQEELVIESLATSQGKLRTKMIIGHHQGENFTIAFNAKYLLDFLSQVKIKQLVLSVNDPLKPVRLTSPELPDYQFLIMPFRLREE